MRNMKGLLPKRSEKTKEWPSVFGCRACPALPHPSWCKWREGGTGKADPCLHVSLSPTMLTLSSSHGWMNPACQILVDISTARIALPIIGL